MIFIDTWVWLEFLGKSSDTSNAVILKPEKIISTATLLELKYHSIKKFGPENTEKIVYLVENDSTVLPLTSEIAKLAADLRLKYYDKKEKALSFIDCINLATAIVTGCDVFYTGDPDFRGIGEIKIEIIS